MDITKKTRENAVEECQLMTRLLEMLQETKHELMQENGQRRLTAWEIIHGEKQRVKDAEIVSWPFSTRLLRGGINADARNSRSFDRVAIDFLEQLADMHSPYSMIQK